MSYKAHSAQLAIPPNAKGKLHLDWTRNLPIHRIISPQELKEWQIKVHASMTKEQRKRAA